MILEVCVTTIQNAILAEQAGANRLEFCRDLSCGGLSPTFKDLEDLTKEVSVPIHVLIRPRAGNFIYSNDEINEMIDQINQCRELGVSGVVFGCLKESRDLDYQRLKDLVEVSDGMSLTFHRAFDFVGRKVTALKELEDLGFDRVLTAGGDGSAEKNLEALELLRLSTRLISIMPGGKIRASNIRRFLRAGFSEIHTSALSGDTHNSDLNFKSEIMEMLDKMGNYKA